MFKKTLLTAACLTSFCFADNFMIGSSQSGSFKAENQHSVEEQHSAASAEKLPQRVVIEDINPSSELGRLVSVMLKNEQKRAAALNAPKPKPKPVAKKKPVKKKVVAKKKPVKKSVAVKKEPHIEIKSEEASKVGEHEKKEAEHNENNSSLKKISSSNICD